MSEEINANPLGPAPDLAVVDKDSQQAVLAIQKPERGIGSGMPEDTYRAIVMLLREGVPNVIISDRFGYSRATVSEIKARHSDIIPSHRELMGRKAEGLRELLSDKMVEAVQNGKLSPNQYAFTYGVVSDNLRQDSGTGNKSESIHLHLDKNDLGDLLGGLKNKQADEKSACVDINPPEKQEGGGGGGGGCRQPPAAVCDG